jgi:hypothetical protein
MIIMTLIIITVTVISEPNDLIDAAFTAGSAALIMAGYAFTA